MLVITSLTCAGFLTDHLLSLWSVYSFKTTPGRYDVYLSVSCSQTTINIITDVSTHFTVISFVFVYVEISVLIW